MKHCLEFWRAHHDIQPSLSPYAMIQYMLSYATKTKKGMRAIMDGPVEKLGKESGWQPREQQPGN